MKFVTSFVSVCLIAISSTNATNLPDFSYHWNNFNEVLTVNDHLIGVSDYGLTVLDYVPDDDNYQQGETVLLEQKPVKTKVYGDSLLIQTVDNRVYVVELSATPRLDLIGTIKPQAEFYDFALHANSIYLACGFDGIKRLSTTASDGAIIDYSNRGVLVTQIDVVDNQLIALDEYNGLITYDLDNPGFGTFKEYLYLDQRAYRFDRLDDSALIIMNKTAHALIAESKDGRLTIGSTIPIAEQPLRIFVSDDMIVLVSARAVETYRKSDYGLIDRGVLSNVYVEGTIVDDDGEVALVFPGSEGGLARVHLDELNLPSEVLAGAGRIRGIDATSRELAVADNNSLELYSVSQTSPPKAAARFRYSNQSVRAITTNGDSVMTLYADGHMMTVYHQGFPPSTRTSIQELTDAGSVRELDFAGMIGDKSGYLVARNVAEAAIYNVSLGYTLAPEAQIELPDNVNDVRIYDTVLAVAYGYNVDLYAIDSAMILTYLTTRQFNLPANRVVLYNKRMITVDGGQLMLWDISEPSRPNRLDVTEFEQSIANIEVVDNYLFTVGPGGAYAIDLSDDRLEASLVGTLPATMLSWVDKILFTSDGTSIHGYLIDLEIGPPGETIPESYALYQNYPNPFNPTTTIQFDLPQASTVSLSIYNSLGQRVKNLIDETMSAGQHTIVWNGTNASGQAVASGIYFYRLKTAGKEATRKMVLLK